MSDELPDVDVGLQELTTLLLADETLTSVLARVAAVANRCVTGGDGVSITLVKNSAPYTAYATDARVRTVDEQQYERRVGPCLAAIATGEVVASCDGDGAPAWSDLAAYAAAIGIQSFLSVPLVVADETVGSLNVYSGAPQAFGASEVEAAHLLAAQAAVSVANAKTHDECVTRLEQLQEALDSRIVIEQAKGVLMERHRLDPDEAFERLRDRSQHTNVKLRVVAADVVASVRSAATVNVRG